jgi:hypothetical protein
VRGVRGVCLVLISLVLVLDGTGGQRIARAASPSLPVFPGAEGFGTTTPAGSGRHLDPANTAVYKVTNLNPAGSGSLRECIEAPGPRVCVFEVSGTIEINDRLVILNPYITIAGQTAPSPGITLKGTTLSIGTHDVLVQHIRVRVGDGAGYMPDNRDGIVIENGEGARQVFNIVVDHCSVSWAIDGNFDLWYEGVHDVTISNSIISEGLNNSLHSKGSHSTGMLVGRHVKRVTVRGSLFAHNDRRNPTVQPDTETELVNNVYYNWGTQAGTAFGGDTAWGPLFANAIGDFYKPGADSPADPPIWIDSQSSPESAIYVRGNIGPGRSGDEQDDWNIVQGNEALYRSPTLAVTSAVATVSTAQEAYDLVLSSAGARPADRDAVDTRIVGDVRDGTGRIIDSQDQVGGWPVLEQNYRALTLPDDPNADGDGDGYTNLEEWLQAYAAEVEEGFAIVPEPPVQVIDPGDSAEYTIEIRPFGGFAHDVELSITDPCSLTLTLSPTLAIPLEQVILTLTDGHVDPELVPGLWCQIPITGTGGSYTDTVNLDLLIGGLRAYFPLVRHHHRVQVHEPR